MRSQTRTVLAVVVFAALVAMAGCADGGSTDPAETPSPDTIQTKATATMQNVSTATFTMDMTMETSQGSLALQADGAMDIPAKRMRMNMSLESQGRTVEVTQYVVDQTAYQYVQGQWQQTDVNGRNIWEQGNQLALQQRMLENSTIEVTGRDTVDGNDVWVVSIQPSDDAVQQLLAGTATGVAENMDFSNVTMTQFVDTDSYHVRKLAMTMDATMQGEAASMDLTMTFGAFGEPVDIRVPDAATQ